METADMKQLVEKVEGLVNSAHAGRAPVKFEAKGDPAHVTRFWNHTTNTLEMVEAPVLDRTEHGWLLAWVERVRARRASALRDDGGGGGEKRLGRSVDRAMGGDRTNRTRRMEEDQS